MLKFFQLQKARKTLRLGTSLYKKKGHLLSEHDRNRFENYLQKLDEAVLNKDFNEVKITLPILSKFIKTHFKKSALDHLREFGAALLIAVFIAFLIRQFWFELYEVPTGSMRPTINEMDRLVVSKTTFGLHIPFTQKALFFDKNNVIRAGTIVFTVENLDVPDADTTYFYLFPGKKRYVKRTMGKGGDTIYFYGGKIYGVDKDGNAFLTLAEDSSLKSFGIENISHVPYINFEGKTILSSPMGPGTFGKALFLQMNQPVAKIESVYGRSLEGLFFNGTGWIKDQLNELKKPHTHPVSYSDLWGIGNFAMARLLSPEESKSFYPNTGYNSYVLELRHTPNLHHPEMRRGELGRAYPHLSTLTTLIPLNENHLDTLKSSMTTARFIISNNHAYRYQEGRKRPQRPDLDPLFPGVPDGCYEFYRGKGYKIHWGGIRTPLPTNHPLYKQNAELTQKLFNLGIGFNLLYKPIGVEQPYFPQRFAYFLDGSLYVMDSPLLEKNDPTLVSFIEKEKQKQDKSSAENPYIAFIDRGAPLIENGEIDKEFLQSFGLKIPDNHLLALGDNYAMSADSRDFGFVPYKNLRGAPSFLFWPPGKRLGGLPQPSYPFFTVANGVVWGLIIVIALVSVREFNKRKKQPIFKKKQD